MVYEGAIGVGPPSVYENTSQYGEWVVKTVVRNLLEAREASWQPPGKVLGLFPCCPCSQACWRLAMVDSP